MRDKWAKKRMRRRQRKRRKMKKWFLNTGNIHDSLCIQKSADLAYEKHWLQMIAHRQYLLLLSISILTTINLLTSNIFYILYFLLAYYIYKFARTKMRDFFVLGGLFIFLVYMHAFLFHLYFFINYVYKFYLFRILTLLFSLINKNKIIVT